MLSAMCLMFDITGAPSLPKSSTRKESADTIDIVSGQSQLSWLECKESNQRLMNYAAKSDTIVQPKYLLTEVLPPSVEMVTLGLGDDSESIRFHGDQIADTLERRGSFHERGEGRDGAKEWEFNFPSVTKNRDVEYT